MKRRVAALACLVATLAGVHLLWLRDSSLVRVEDVEVMGLTSGEAREIRTRLEDSARSMTTLHVREDELEGAVAAYPSVAGVETSSDLPHGLTISVVERRPVATVEGPDGQAVPVAADATLLAEFDPDHPLPRLPASTPSTSGRLSDEPALIALAAAAAAPRPLARRLDAIERGQEGEMVALLGGGPRVLLGDGSALEEKWAAATAAIAEGGGAGAEYVDVSLPERPAVGG